MFWTILTVSKLTKKKFKGNDVRDHLRTALRGKERLLQDEKR